MAIIKRGTKIGGAVTKTNIGDGKYVSLLASMKLLKDEMVRIQGEQKKRDVLEITYRLPGGIVIKKRVFFSLTIGSQLIDLIETVTGEIPDYIDDLEELLLNKKVIVEVENNEVGNKCYSNIVEIYPISMMEEFDLEDNVEIPKSKLKPKTNLSELFDDSDED